MTPGARRFALTVHLTSSVGWIGALLAYLGVAVTSRISQDLETIRGAFFTMEVMVSFVLVPLAFASLISGVVMALGSKWGLFRHYWVLFSLVLTAFATGVLLTQVASVSAHADFARAADAATLGEGADLIHPGGGLIVLLVIQALNVYKPQGLTPYGWRKQQQQRQQRAAARAEATV